MVEKGNIMLRQLFVTLGLALCAQLAHAAQAGKIIFAVGQAQVVDRPASEGAAVQEGDMLTTGADGFIYVKTVDNGLFILRPNTRARIASYHIDANDPTNTRIKLELLSGVARSKSGDAVKLARQNFRFNTPVAAIGVRGTDFTVFTDQDTSRVAVITGGVIVSGFVGACRPEGIGPCEGTTSRELSAAQHGQLLQVQRGQVAPQLMQGGALAPDQMAPPRGDEPIGKNGGVNSASSIVPIEPSLDAKKNESLITAGAGAGSTTPGTPPVVTAPPVVEVVTPPVPQLPERTILWGRWQPVLGQPAQLGLNADNADRIALMSNFVLFRTQGRDYVQADHGTIGFGLKASEAYVFNDDPSKAVIPATIQNGQLNVDFGKSTFATSFDLNANNEVFKMRSEGAVGPDGKLYGGYQFTNPNNMSVNGVLSNEQGGAAAYLFQGRLDATRTANGATYWGK
jgi:hypothetical protein